MKTIFLLLLAVFLTASVEAATISYSNFNTNQFVIGGTAAQPIISVTNVSGGGTIATNLFAGLPHIWLFTNNYARLQDGSVTNWPNSITAGLQEAINTFSNIVPAGGLWNGGGTIELAPGIYSSATNIHCNFSLALIGQGYKSTFIVMTNSANPVDLITFGNRTAGTYTNMPNFVLYGISFDSVTNSTNSLVMFQGNTNGIEKVMVDMCQFAPWEAITNLNPFRPYQACNLIGVNLQANYCDWCIIRNCQPLYINSFYLAADHMEIEYNFFVWCGTGVNNWPNTSVFRPGAAVVVGQLTGIPNSYEDLVSKNNYFLYCTFCYYITTNTVSKPVSYDDAIEGSPNYVLTGGPSFTSVNLRDNFDGQYILNYQYTGNDTWVLDTTRVTMIKLFPSLSFTAGTPPSFGTGAVCPSNTWSTAAFLATNNLAVGSIVSEVNSNGMSKWTFWNSNGIVYPISHTP